MDMITLAMAKAYTDEKVASGGGSGGGVCLPVVELETVLPAPSSGNIPLSKKDKSALTEAFNTRTPIVLYCRDSENCIYAGTALHISFADDLKNCCYQMMFPDGGFVVVEMVNGEWQMYVEA